MAKKQANEASRANAGKVIPKPAVAAAASPGSFLSSLAADGRLSRKGHIVVMSCIAIITWLLLQTCLNNLLTNWDDPGYIRDNAAIKDLSAEGLKVIFTTPIMGNYHPLTILTYAIEYSFVRLQPWLFHFDSLALHVLVTLLVYWFVYRLTGKAVAAAAASLLFGLHPMHMESVAWLSGRKDVVYAAFYMAACIAWIHFARAAKENKGKWYAVTISLFVCSLLSKPVAVVLPVTLLLIDHYEGRNLSWRLLAEKLPMFTLSVAAGIKSMYDQHAFGSIAAKDEATYTIAERIGLGGYAFVTYLWKAVAPVRLSNFYPYPDKVNGALPYAYYLYPLAVAVLIALVWIYARKNKAVVFGTLFFIVNIALLLQFIPVGGAIIADRYSYIAYLGLFFMAGMGVAALYTPGVKSKWGSPAIGISAVYIAMLGWLSHERCEVWYDTTSLWTDEIIQQPNAPNAYNNLGFNYFNKYNESVNPSERKVFYDSSYYLLHKAIEISPTFVNSYISLGELERTAGNFAAAKAHYYRALALKSFNDDGNAYLGLAIIYAITQKFDSAGFCFREALRLKPYFPEAHSNYGNFLSMTNRPQESLAEYAKAISQNPDMYAPYLNRGRALQRMRRPDEAMKDFEKCLALAPDMGEIYYARAYCYAMKGSKALAVQDIEKALSLGFTQIDQNFYRAMKGR